MYLINIVGKIYYQESRGKPFKTYVKKQDTYYLRCKTRTDNKLIATKQVVNKLIAQKQAVLIVILKNQFLKKNTNLIKRKNSFCKLQNMHIYCENCKKYKGKS